jgi:glycosyltransferase involved in cell wall biosynthesis
LPVHHKKIILAVGRLVNYKGFDVLIEAASSLPADCAILIVGTGPQKTELSDKITKNKLQDKVFLLGTVDAETLELLYRVSYVFCLPSTTRAEAFGVVLLEALSYGLPIVSTNISGSGVGWVNQHGETGFTVPVNQPGALSDAIIKLLENQPLHEKLGKNCRLRFISTFEHNLCNQRITKLYENLIKQY